MTLLPSLPSVGAPGQIATTKPWYAETCRYAGATQAAIYQIDLNPIAGSIANNNQYSLLINNVAVTLTYTASGGSAVQNLAAQLASLISRYGFYWAVIQSAGVLRLTSRTPGAQDPVALSNGLIGATLTTIQPALTPQPLTAGTLVWFLPPSLTEADGHRLVSTYDVASVAVGFNAVRDIAGIVVRPNSNYGSIDTVSGDYFDVLRQGTIWCRNYGSVALDRRVQVRSNNLVPTAILPGGAIGNGLDLSSLSLTVRDLAYDSYALPGEMVRLRIQLN
jgi:hypothetical protein